MEKPYHQKCPECSKDIYGFSKKDLEWKMLMHSLIHRKQEREAQKTTQNETESKAI